MFNYIKTATSSIWANKIRSILTVLGVIIGVTSVCTLISIGQGLKNDVSSLIQGLGSNVMVVVAGKIDTNNLQSSQQTNPANFISGDILTLNDVSVIEELPSIEAVSPMTLVQGDLKFQNKVAIPTLAGVYPSALKAFQVIKIQKGEMFKTKDAGNVIVIGYNTAKTLFPNTSPIGKKITVGKNQKFTVIGTLANSKSSASFASEMNNLALIPFDTATQLNKGEVTIFRIAAKAGASADVKKVKKEIKEQVLKNHDGEENFTVLTQDDILGVFSTFLNLATALVSAIASISLIVGGIGIMNIMLVTVTERTREIGLRKAVGATKMAILWQFLIEAVIITFLGGVLGLAVTFAITLVVANQTELQPAITWNVIGIAVGISMIIGIIFGLWPALRAANKDPIEALRYE